MHHKENHIRLQGYMHRATCVWVIVLVLVLLGDGWKRARPRAAVR
jgi:hypothetical protein